MREFASSFYSSVKFWSPGQGDFVQFQNSWFKPNMNKHVFPELDVIENERSCS